MDVVACALGSWSIKDSEWSLEREWQFLSLEIMGIDVLTKVAVRYSFNLKGYWKSANRLIPAKHAYLGCREHSLWLSFIKSTLLFSANNFLVWLYIYFFYFWNFRPYPPIGNNLVLCRKFGFQFFYLRFFSEFESATTCRGSLIKIDKTKTTVVLVLKFTS